MKTIKLFLGAAMALCLFTFLGCPKPNPVVLSSDIIARYTFNGNLIDSTGHHHDGNAVGTLRYRPDAIGHPRSAILLDGCDGVVIPDSPALSFSETSSFTLRAQIKTTDSSDVGIICKGPESNTVPGYRLELRRGRPRAEITARGANVDIIGPSLVADNRWHTLTLTVSPSEVKLYVDTTQVAQKIGAHIKPDSSNNEKLFLGKAPGSGLYYRGLLDNVRIINGALTRDQIINDGDSIQNIGVSTLSEMPPGVIPTSVSMSDLLCAGSAQILGMCWPTTSTGYCCGTVGTILKSTNSGVDWYPCPTAPAATSEPLFRISFASDAMHGVAIGDNCTILQTANGGTNWNLVALGGNSLPTTLQTPGTAHFYDVKFIDGARVVIVGGGMPDATHQIGLATLSTDDGLTWTALTDNFALPIYTVGQFSTTTWFFGANGYIGQWLNSTGSVSPDPVVSGGTSDFVSSDFSSATVAIAGTQDGRVFRYSGSSWAVDPQWSNPDHFVAGVHFRAGEYWLAADDNTPASNGNLYQSVNSGTNWAGLVASQNIWMYSAAGSSHGIAFIPHPCSLSGTTLPLTWK